MKTYVIGVDVGGTNIKLGLVNPTGRIISKTRLDTKSFGADKTKLIDALVAAIRSLLDKNKIKKQDILGMGIGLPGLIDPQLGIVRQLPNIPGWKDVPLGQLLKNKLKIPIFIENDVKLISLAEWKYGAGRGCSDFICITLGTGIGGGLIFNNKLYTGPGFVAGEIGHIPIKENGIPCPCGGRGCFERYVGNGYLLQKARRIFKDSRICLPDVRIMAERGNKKAIQFWHEVGETLAQGLIGVTNLLNPRMIIIGGGVANNFPRFAPVLRGLVKKHAMKVQGKMVRIVRARFVEGAGILGADVLVRQACRE
jgi:glucokinase